MITLNTGDIYIAEKAKSGKSRMGSWEILLVNDNRGNNEICIFVKNMPSNVSEGDKFKIDRIISVTSGFKKSDDDKWKQVIAIDAEVTKVEE